MVSTINLPYDAFEKHSPDCFSCCIYQWLYFFFLRNFWPWFVILWLMRHRQTLSLNLHDKCHPHNSNQIWSFHKGLLFHFLIAECVNKVTWWLQFKFFSISFLNVINCNFSHFFIDNPNYIIKTLKYHTNLEIKQKAPTKRFNVIILKHLHTNICMFCIRCIQLLMQ